MSDPGIRYAFAYGVADPTFMLRSGQVRLGDAGKLMALAAFGQRRAKTGIEDDFLQAILNPASALDCLDKSLFESSPYFNIAVESPEFKQVAKHLSDAIFDTFLERIRPFVLDNAPLLISGGCGLNCDWNSNWLNSGLFSDVFVPPCPNDVGSAIGTAIDAQHHLSGDAKILWSVYSGQMFDDDVDVVEGFAPKQMVFSEIAELLYQGAILGWAQDRAEIGPRALGNRSILAAPFSKHTLDRLNIIKRRENFRPIAPICLEESAARFFKLDRPSPHMLYFSRVKNSRLQAITHVDGSARPQTVNSSQNLKIYSLLKAFELASGYGVLCNTSLNFNGAGFINKTSDLAKYAKEGGLDGFVVNDKLYLANQHVGSA
ncbi:MULTISPECIES: carbamoyltransferase C-terminal domain-containing protein [Paraburkholderia]|uniref:carbamoyltransferase C-terminal domain-containing protein n=1 Tax=Paraburkholderia TaxID=1822464 RepID=UPI0038BDEBEA